jgi:hypothetical protein
MARRRAARVDDNQGVIVDAFRQLGASCVLSHAAGEGMTDLIIGKHGITVLCEVKDGDKPPSAQKKTPSQVIFHNEFKGAITTVNCVDDVQALISLMLRQAKAIKLIEP